MLRAGPVSVQAFAAKLMLDLTTMGWNLRPLKHDGLVASETDPVDRRARRLSITGGGAARIRAAAPREPWRRWNSRHDMARAGRCISGPRYAS